MAPEPPPVGGLVQDPREAVHRRERDPVRGGYTELGYQTRPPDRFGVSPARQAAYINESNWIAYRSRRVHSIAQYELVDEPDAAVFNTGLRFTDGRAKPALAAFRMPIWVDRARRGVTVFGQVRPGLRGETVRIQFRRRHGHYRTLARVLLRNNRGYLVRHFRARAGYWRLVWAPPGSSDELHSRTARS